MKLSSGESPCTRKSAPSHSLANFARYGGREIVLIRREYPSSSPCFTQFDSFHRYVKFIAYRHRLGFLPPCPQAYRIWSPGATHTPDPRPGQLLKPVLRINSPDSLPDYVPDPEIRKRDLRARSPDMLPGPETPEPVFRTKAPVGLSGPEIHGFRFSGCDPRPEISGTPILRACSPGRRSADRTLGYRNQARRTELKGARHGSQDC